MNAERLHAIAKSLQKEADTEHKLMTALTKTMEEYVESPTDADAQKKLAADMEKVKDFLSKSLTKSLSPAWSEALKSFGVDRLLGEELRQEIDGIFETNQLTPVVAFNSLTTLTEEIGKFSQATDDLVNGFGYYEIPDEKLNPGECELGFMIPRKAVDNQLDELGEEFKELNRILAPFSELTVGGRPPFEVRSISASDFYVNLTTACATIACFAKSVEWLMNAYKSLLEIKKLRSDMISRGIPDASMKEVDSYACGIMETTINKVTNDLLNQFGSDIEEGRRYELSMELKISLNKVANRIDAGYNIDVRAEPPQVAEGEPEDSDLHREREYFNIINSVQENLKFIHHDGKPLLQLPTKVENITPPPLEPVAAFGRKQPAKRAKRTKTPKTPKKRTKKKSAD